MSRTHPNGSVDFLDRLGGDARHSDVDVFSESEYRAFGVSRRAWGGEPMIDFIRRDGNRHSLPYARLDEIQFNPSKGIALRFSDYLVTLQGQRLAEGYQQLLAHRVVFVAEAGRADEMALADQEPVVTKLLIEARRFDLS